MMEEGIGRNHYKFQPIDEKVCKKMLPFTQIEGRVLMREGGNGGCG